jgi:hypothetical protein
LGTCNVLKERIRFMEKLRRRSALGILAVATVLVASFGPPAAAAPPRPPAQLADRDGWVTSTGPRLAP